MRLLERDVLMVDLQIKVRYISRLFMALKVCPKYGQTAMPSQAMRLPSLSPPAYSFFASLSSS